MPILGREGDFSAFAPVARAVCVAAGCLVLAQCSGSLSGKIDPKYGVSASPRVIAPGQPVPKGGGVYRVGRPYVVAGRTYVPQEDPDYRAEGLASWYGEDFHGRLTANGEIFDMDSISAAHPTLPIPSYVRVTNLRNGRSIVARVNDRGPYHENRVVDVSLHTAKLLGFHQRGLARVRVEYVGKAPLEGSDDRVLVATLREHGPAPAPGRVMLASAKPFTPRAPARPPVPESRPFSLGDDDARAQGDARPEVTTVARAAPRPRARPSELTASSRVERTMGPKPTLAWVTGPSGIPSSGVLAPTESAASYAPRQPAKGSELLSGRGLY
jgi:rare lipoprotein A